VTVTTHRPLSNRRARRKYGCAREGIRADIVRVLDDKLEARRRPTWSLSTDLGLNTVEGAAAYGRSLMHPSLAFSPSADPNSCWAVSEGIGGTSEPGHVAQPTIDLAKLQATLETLVDQS
jgi:hypothetical protein